MNKDRIGKFILKNRKKLNLTQEELAEKLGVTCKSISRWENGKTMPDLSLLNEICDILNISLNELLLGENINKNDIVKRSEETVFNALSEKDKQQKKNNLIINILIGLLILLLLFLIIDKYPKMQIFNFTLQQADPEKPYELNKELTINNRNLYYYGIDNTSVCNKKDKCYSLEKVLKNKQISLNDFQDYLENQIKYEDYEKTNTYDGVSIYKKDGMIILFCNTENGNKDVYVGNDKILENLNGEYCGLPRNQVETYKRTYKIITTTIHDNRYNSVTLEQNNNRETVLISNEYSLIPGQTYIFSFITFDEFNDNIKNIFNKSIIKKVVETDSNSLVNEKIIISKDVIKNNELDHVRMDIVEGTLTNTKVKIRITDYSNYEYIYGSDYHIDKYENGEWKTLKPKKEMFFISMAYYPDINGHLDFNIDWYNSYGNLIKGKYRIVKSVSSKYSDKNNKYISAQFEIK